MTSNINAGDRVKYARTFLRSIGAFTGPIPFRTGTVDSVGAEVRPKGPRVAHVRWDDEPDAPGAVLTCNLVRADRLHLEPV